MTAAPLRLLVLLAALSAGAAMADCPAPPGADAAAAEIGRLVNAERAKQGLAPLRRSDRLAKAAGAHACDMARHGYFAHEGRSGGSVKDRAARAGYRACLIAENIAMGYRGPAEAHAGWMGSSGHRRNILLGQARDFGVGLAAPGPGQGGGLRWVLVLGTPC